MKWVLLHPKWLMHISIALRHMYFNWKKSKGKWEKKAIENPECAQQKWSRYSWHTCWISFHISIRSEVVNSDLKINSFIVPFISCYSTLPSIIILAGCYFYTLKYLPIMIAGGIEWKIMAQFSVHSLFSVHYINSNSQLCFWEVYYFFSLKTLLHVFVLLPTMCDES